MRIMCNGSSLFGVGTPFVVCFHGKPKRNHLFSFKGGSAKKRPHLAILKGNLILN